MGGNCKASPWPVWCCQDCHHNHQLPCRLGSTANHTQHTTLFGRFLSNPCFACSCAGRTTTLRTAGTRQLASTMQRNQTYVCQRAVLFMPSSLYTHTHTHAHTHTHTHTHTHARTHVYAAGQQVQGTARAVKVVGLGGSDVVLTPHIGRSGSGQ